MPPSRSPSLLVLLPAASLPSGRDYNELRHVSLGGMPSLIEAARKRFKQKAGLHMEPGSTTLSTDYLNA